MQIKTMHFCTLSESERITSSRKCIFDEILSKFWLLLKMFLLFGVKLIDQRAKKKSKWIDKILNVIWNHIDEFQLFLATGI